LSCGFNVLINGKSAEDLRKILRDGSDWINKKCEEYGVAYETAEASVQRV